jgi:hypothetical protein
VVKPDVTWAQKQGLFKKRHAIDRAAHRNQTDDSGGNNESPVK